MLPTRNFQTSSTPLQLHICGQVTTSQQENIWKARKDIMSMFMRTKLLFWDEILSAINGFQVLVSWQQYKLELKNIKKLFFVVD